MVIGGVAFFVDAGLFAALHVAAGLNVILANVISTSTAVVLSFTANTMITFKVTDRLVRRFAGFVGVSGCGFLISTGLLWVFVMRLGAPAVIIKIGSVPVVFLVQFMLNSHVTFAKPVPRIAVDAADNESVVDQTRESE